MRGQTSTVVAWTATVEAVSISFLDGGNRIRFSGTTDVGRVRDHNEDNLFLPDEMPLAVVSDGMGGHACGEVASGIAVQTIDGFYKSTVGDGLESWPFRMPRLHTERDRFAVVLGKRQSIRIKLLFASAWM